jgi:hypothetical protein
MRWILRSVTVLAVPVAAMLGVAYGGPEPLQVFIWGAGLLASSMVFGRRLESVHKESPLKTQESRRLPQSIGSSPLVKPAQS